MGLFGARPVNLNRESGWLQRKRILRVFLSGMPEGSPNTFNVGSSTDFPPKSSSNRLATNFWASLVFSGNNKLSSRFLEHQTVTLNLML